MVVSRAALGVALLLVTGGAHELSSAQRYEATASSAERYPAHRGRAAERFGAPHEAAQESSAIFSGRLRAGHVHGASRTAALLQNARLGAKGRGGRQPVPLYIPKIGLANVTTPTASPPPPPILNWWEDYQPIDTALGSEVIQSFIEPPTITPPPSQAALDQAFGCPVLLGFPGIIEISTPNPCHSGLSTALSGQWIDSNTNTTIVDWGLNCQMYSSSITPMVAYTMPNGDGFGFSHDVSGFSGNYMDTMDCLSGIKYSIEEKVYHQTRDVDADLCSLCGSCDGTVFVQYFVYQQPDRTLVATTAYLKIFQESFTIIDGGGNPLATATRIGGWSACQNTCPTDPAEASTVAETPRNWRLEFASSATGPLALDTERWVLSMMMTMLAVRDTSRGSNGMIAPSACELAKSTVDVSILILLLVLAIILPTIWWFCCMQRARMYLFTLEQNICPRRMMKPSKYEGN